MTTWQMAWHRGIAPGLSTAALLALRRGLESNDPRLLQDVTVCPPPLQRLQGSPVERACPVGYCGWQGEGLKTVAEVEEYFARACFEANRRLGEPAGCRYFLNWWDDSPREEARRLLLVEVNRTLAGRLAGASAASGSVA